MASFCRVYLAAFVERIKDVNVRRVVGHSDRNQWPVRAAGRLAIPRRFSGVSSGPGQLD
jgi:hypothetical protein